MKITEHENDYGYLITEDDQELLCPFTRNACLMDKCAMSVFIENHEGTTYYCGFIANEYNTSWNEGCNRTPRAHWTKGITREKICDEEDGGDTMGKKKKGCGK